MTDETGAPAGGEPIAVVTPAPDAPAEFSSPTSAAKYLASLRHKPKEQNPAPVEQPQADPVEQPELAQANTDPATDPGEAPEATDPAELPPIEPPRSWTRAEKERFQSLPRETQEYLHTREQERDREFRRSQNEIAEQRKAIQAERETAEKVRQQLEADVKAARDVLEREQRTKFPDIKSWDDYERISNEASRLATTDPFAALQLSNYLKDFDTHQRSVQYNAQQAKQLEDQKAQERQSKRAEYEAEQNALLIELVPEMADPKKANDLRTRAVAMLTDDLGLKTDQLSRWIADDTGHEILSNAGIQKLIADGLKYREIKSAPKAVVKPDLPPVQRPGTAKPSGSTVSAQIQALQERFNQTGSLRDAQALRAARLAAGNRRAS